jgi:hypothetical protein
VILMRKLFFFILIVITLAGAILWPDDTRNIVVETLMLWFLLVLPSIAPMYLISHLLITTPLFTRLLYPMLKPIMHFENETSCAIYVVSILSGNPTATSLIVSSLGSGMISLNEANRLMKFCSFISPLFIINFSNRLHSGFAGFFIFSQILGSIVIAYFLKNDQDHGIRNGNTINLEMISSILSSCPNVMLNIATTMVLVNLLKQPFTKLLEQFAYSGIALQYLLCLLEIGTGLSDILKADLPLMTGMILFSILFSFSGGAIHLQVITLISKKGISYINFLIYRIIHVFIALFFLFGFIFGLWLVQLIILGVMMILKSLLKGIKAKEKRKNLFDKLFL